MKALFILSLLVFLSACVEIKDPEKDLSETSAEQEPLLVQKGAELIVDQPLYLYEGNFLTQEEFQKKAALPSLGRAYSYEFERMEIHPGAVLYTLGHTVTIQVNEFLSEGQIETFPENSTAQDKEDGRHGGSLSMKIAMATGSLKVILRGQMGGKGAEGRDPDEALNGKDGASLGSSECHNAEAIARWEGHEGKPGYDGEQGRRGGNSGTLDFVVEKYHLWNFSYMSLPGIGGAGGNGNKTGGRPGKSGFSYCSAYGFMGRIENISKVGRPGGVGKKGPDGIAELVCITKDGSKDCVR